MDILDTAFVELKFKDFEVVTDNALTVGEKVPG